MSSKMPNAASMTKAERKAYAEALREGKRPFSTLGADVPHGPTIAEVLGKVPGIEGAAVMDRSKMRDEALDRTATTPKQFLLGHSPIPRFYTEKKLPPFEEIRDKLHQTKSILLDRQGKPVDIDAGPRIPYAGDSEMGTDNAAKMKHWMGMQRAPKMTAPGGSGWHKLVEAHENGKVFSVEKKGEPLFVLEGYISDPPHIFVVEHDWAAAFDGATDIEEGEYYLPYEHCAFEFRIEGLRVIMSAIDITDDQGRFDSAMVFIEGSGGCWYCGGMGGYKSRVPDTGDDNFDRVAMILTRNIRALCIGLDAEVIEREVVRAPIKLNQARERSHKAPLPDHSVVRLANRSRVAPLENHTGDGPRWHPRLHFVRGHWRHFTDHKTWIRWHLRGNPDLGFIDKHYRA